MARSGAQLSFASETLNSGFPRKEQSFKNIPPATEHLC